MRLATLWFDQNGARLIESGANLAGPSKEIIQIFPIILLCCRLGQIGLSDVDVTGTKDLEVLKACR